MYGDSALRQQWHGSGAQGCQGLNNHYFLDAYLNLANYYFIGIYAKNRCRWSGCLIELEISWQRFGGLKQFRENVYLAPTLRKNKGFLNGGIGGHMQSLRGLYGRGGIVGRTHSRLNHTASICIGPTWGQSCLIRSGSCSVALAIWWST